MVSYFLVYYLIGHFLADFYLQTEKKAKKKSESFKQLIIHCIIYQAVALIPFIWFIFDLWLLLIGVIIGVSHFLIDYIKAFLFNNTKVNKIYAFILDQGLHILIIVFLVNIFAPKLVQNSFALDFSIEYIIYFRWLLVLVLILKPANIAFKILFGNLKPEVKEEIPKDNNDGVPIKNAGAIIGNFERLLYIFCLIFSQFTALGLIIAGKGFARHSYIQSNPGFAEYFLIGTFYSILYAVISYIAVFHLI